jgi:peptidoglycan hydrolase CwlO-like protein
MSDTVIVAIITAGSAVLTAVTALLLNYRGFSSLENRMAAIEGRISSLDQRIYDLTGAVNELDKRITKVEIKLDIQP